MARIKVYQDTNVLDEAKARIRHIFDLFDHIVVSFSGGKDSLTVLHLVREVSLELGIEHVNALFWDEELIPDPVVQFVDEYRQKDWVRLTWLAIPLISNKYVLGENARYIQWDPNRRHIRPIPPWAQTLEDLGLPADHLVSQYDLNDLAARNLPGRVAVLTGVRAAESLIRLRASVNKLNENYINYGKTARFATCKPIFDWQENDVFRYFYDRGIRYCPVYDNQVLSGTQLRVATPLLAESAKRFGRLREWAPDFYDQVIDVFPEMVVQERYYAELDQDGLFDQYASDWNGIEQWIRANITEPAQRALAAKRFQAVRIRASARPEAYPLRYVLKAFVTGAYKREILPLRDG